MFEKKKYAHKATDRLKKNKTKNFQVRSQI